MRKTIIILVTMLIAVPLFAQKYPDSRTDGKFYMINGAKIWTVSFGKGEPLFFIPGGPGNAHTYLRAFDSLSDANALVFYDGFGRGKSDTAKNVSEYTISRDIEDLEALRIALGYEKINVLGHSYGTVVAQGYALKYPGNVSHLLLLAPFHSNVMWQENDDNCNREIKTGYPEVWDTLMVIRNNGYKSADQLHQSIYWRVPYGFLYSYNPDNFSHTMSLPYPNTMNTRLYYQMVGNDGDFTVTNEIGNFDYRQQLKTLKMKILILAGRYDRVAVPMMSVQYKNYCPQAQFVMFEKSGHNMFIEEPEKTFELIRAFLAD